MGIVVDMASFRKARQPQLYSAELIKLERELEEASDAIRFARTVIEREQGAIKFYQVKLAILKIKDNMTLSEGLGRGLTNSQLTIID